MDSHTANLSALTCVSAASSSPSFVSTASCQLLKSPLHPSIRLRESSPDSSGLTEFFWEIC